MRALLTVLLLLPLLSLTPASAEVYRWTDAKGVTHYGDKAPSDQAKPVQLPPLQTYSPPPVPSTSPNSTASAEKPAEAGTPPPIRITSPAQDETIREAGKQLSVSVDVALRQGQGLLYFLDGVQQNKVATVSTAFLFEAVERGEHSITAAVVTAEGKELIRAAPVTVNIKPPIVLR
ncbi:DUF4124 domain-containing protein [Nevskia sp.]|uniref:DUF4124 domain-containing protein n=1 Tax=Nevskia sp. TaxID=1929292 RepID=UPI0025D1B92A|nr:DUF4124 domain-containing protein [Nevskia sp.]